ncbi:MAG: tetratricopeptide repeat protein [Thalassotalea sp.]
MSSSLPITLDNFQQVVIEASKTKLVLIAFWAEQIPESIELRDKLAAGTSNSAEQVIMADVDCQSQQQIAQQFGLQSLPTAIIIKDGQPLDGLAGPQTDEAIKVFLEKYLPKAEDTLLLQAQEALAAEDVNSAYNAALQAYQLDNERADIKLVLADAALAFGKTDEASQLIETITMVDQDSYYQTVKTKLEMTLEAANSPELQALEKAVAETPDNVELIHKLAGQYTLASRFEDALTLLFRRVQTVRDDEKSKEFLLDVLQALPKGDVLATKFRRKLYTLMY